MYGFLKGRHKPTEACLLSPPRSWRFQDVEAISKWGLQEDRLSSSPFSSLICVSHSERDRTRPLPNGPTTYDGSGTRALGISSKMNLVQRDVESRMVSACCMKSTLSSGFGSRIRSHHTRLKLSSADSVGRKYQLGGHQSCREGMLQELCRLSSRLKESKTVCLVS